MIRTALVFLCLVPSIAAAQEQGAADDAQEQAQRKLAEQKKRLRYFNWPALTPPKAAAIQQLLNLVVLDDLGKLPGQYDRAALHRQFYALEADALPILVGWMDQCANLYGTCPTTVIGGKIAQFVKPGNGTEDFDTVALIDRELGRALRIKDPPAAYKSLRAIVDNQMRELTRQRQLTYKAMEFPQVMDRFKIIADPKAPRLAEWRVLLEHLGTRKRDDGAFDALLDALKAAKTAEERRALRAALVSWSGVDLGPVELDNPRAVPSAVNLWKEWKARQSGQ